MTSGNSEPQPRRGDGDDERWFLAGALFVPFFSFPQGMVKVSATVMLELPVLRLWDAELQPTSGEPIQLGIRGIRAILAELCHQAVKEGFDRITVSGFRVGGANPGRETDWIVPCMRHR